jgi:hypothetical protein
MNTQEKLVSTVGLIIATITLACLVWSSDDNWSNVSAETGQGKDIFRIVISLEGVNQSRTGDIVTVVRVNNETQVKSLDIDNFSSTSAANSSTINGGLIQYEINFPNVNVKSGDEYNACVFAAKTTTLVCKGASNSPAIRPEYVDLTVK